MLVALQRTARCHMDDPTSAPRKLRLIPHRQSTQSLLFETAPQPSIASRSLWFPADCCRVLDCRRPLRSLDVDADSVLRPSSVLPPPNIKLSCRRLKRLRTWS